MTIISYNFPFVVLPLCFFISSLLLGGLLDDIAHSLLSETIERIHQKQFVKSNATDQESPPLTNPTPDRQAIETVRCPLRGFTADSCYHISHQPSELVLPSSLPYFQPIPPLEMIAPPVRYAIPINCHAAAIPQPA